MDLFIDAAGGRGLSEQIRGAIAAGRLRVGGGSFVAGAPLVIRPAQVGLHLTALLPRPGDEEKVQAAAAARGIATSGLSQYFHARPAWPGLVIGFGRSTPLPSRRRWMSWAMPSMRCSGRMLFGLVVSGELGSRRQSIAPVTCQDRPADH